MQQDYLEAYDSQLRIDAELTGALDVTRFGPLHLASFAGGRGFVTYADLGGADAGEIAGLVEAVVRHYLELSGIDEVEWKTRGHDAAPGLHDTLIARGFAPDAPESIMIGEAAHLAQPIETPPGVELRRTRAEDEVLAAGEMQGRVFDDRDWRSGAEDLASRLRADDTVELWIAVADDAVIGAGRLEPVENTSFAGLWGGSTVPEWRGRGVYRALTAERARSALARGIRYLHSDSTEFSRPILERSGLMKVSTTTPYVWKRPSGSAGLIA